MFTRFAPLLLLLLWSLSFIAAKAGLRHMSPLLFFAICWAGCAVVQVAPMVVLEAASGLAT